MVKTGLAKILIAGKNIGLCQNCHQRKLES